MARMVPPTAVASGGSFAAFVCFRESPQRRAALDAEIGSPERYMLFGLDELVARGDSRATQPRAAAGCAGLGAARRRRAQPARASWWRLRRRFLQRPAEPAAAECGRRRLLDRGHRRPAARLAPARRPRATAARLRLDRPAGAAREAPQLEHLASLCRMLCGRVHEHRRVQRARGGVVARGGRRWPAGCVCPVRRRRRTVPTGAGDHARRRRRVDRRRSAPRLPAAPADCGPAPGVALPHRRRRGGRARARVAAAERRGRGGHPVESRRAIGSRGRGWSRCPCARTATRARRRCCCRRWRWASRSSSHGRWRSRVATGWPTARTASSSSPATSRRSNARCSGCSPTTRGLRRSAPARGSSSRQELSWTRYVDAIHAALAAAVARH